MKKKQKNFTQQMSSSLIAIHQSLQTNLQKKNEQLSIKQFKRPILMTL